MLGGVSQFVNDVSKTVENMNYMTIRQRDMVKEQKDLLADQKSCQPPAVKGCQPIAERFDASVNTSPMKKIPNEVTSMGA